MSSVPGGEAPSWVAAPQLLSPALGSAVTAGGQPCPHVLLPTGSNGWFPGHGHQGPGRDTLWHYQL
jgi:hypothetical protein